MCSSGVRVSVNSKIWESSEESISSYDQKLSMIYIGVLQLTLFSSLPLSMGLVKASHQQRLSFARHFKLYFPSCGRCLNFLWSWRSCHPCSTFETCHRSHFLWKVSLSCLCDHFILILCVLTFSVLTASFLSCRICC